MKKVIVVFATIFTLLHGIFIPAAFADDKPYVVLSEDLAQLKQDFNAKTGTVRLLFIIGPTCGICLRGMADLNDEFLAEYQTDPRLHTFSVHVPTLRAEEKHVAPSVALMNGPRIYHYWDEAGTIGLLYQDILDTEAYVWDVWFIYGPDAVWEGAAPPEPAYWEHQLPVFPREKKLDKKRFAAETLARVNQLDLNDFDTSAVAANENPLADGAVIPWVGQGYGRAIKQYREGQGGTLAIRAIESREYSGELLIGDETFALFVTEERPNKKQKHVPDLDYVLRYDGGEIVERHGNLPVEGVPLDIEGHLMGFFDFDTPLVDWNKKGHKFSMQGMEKTGDALAWNLVQTDPAGLVWKYLINSHTGNIERIRAHDEAGELIVSVHYSDYKTVDGAPVAHRIEYRNPAGKLLAVEKFDSVKIQRATQDAGE